MKRFIISLGLIVFLFTPDTAQSQATGPSLYYVFVRSSRVALLPFVNYTESVNVGDSLMPRLRRELIGRSVELADSADIETVLRKYRIRNTVEPSIQQIQLLSDELEVSYILVGSIDYVRTDAEAIEVALAARLIYVPTVEIVWSGTASAHSDDRRLPFELGKTLDTNRLIARASMRLLQSFNYTPPSRTRRIDSIQVYLHRQEIAKPCRSILILPFSNESHAAAAGYAVQNQFVAQLMSDGYSLIEPARAQQILYETRCGAGEISVEAVNVMRRELGADFILTGTVETYSGAFVPDWGDDPEVSMQVRLIDAAEGTIAWSQTASRRGSQGLVMFGYGATHGLNDLSRQLVRSLVHAIPHTTILEANSVSNATGYAQ